MSKLKYTTDFPSLVEMYLRGGAIEAIAAKKLGVSVQTFEEYKRKYPEFLEAIKRGKAPVDFEVENNLLKRAQGYTYVEKTTITRVTADGEGIVAETRQTTKHVSPDVTAQIFWLKNRKPERWRDVKAVELSGKDGSDLIPKANVDLSKLSDSVLEEMRKACK